uniref:Rab-GAP TBC domain-containing protein n=1 Tax=Tetradesmus obliquus TaxID=3088 RepID=A0A383V4E2_TETOB
MPPKKRRQKVQTATAAAKAHSQDTTRLINQALADGNDIAQLRKLAAVRGLVNTELRAKLWPRLLAGQEGFPTLPAAAAAATAAAGGASPVPHAAAHSHHISSGGLNRRLSISSPVAGGSNSSSSGGGSAAGQSEALEQYLEWAAGTHKDSNTVKVDVERSLHSFASFLSSEEREARREELARLLNAVVVKHEGAVHYYQGLHDVAAVLLLVAGELPAFDLLCRLATGHLRDATRPSLDPVIELLGLMQLIVREADSELASFLEQQGLPPFYALSWYITWFSHDLSQFGEVCRLFDLFLATHPLMPLYVGAVAMHSQRSQLLAAEEMPMLHSKLVNLAITKRATADQLAVQAIELFKRAPPQQLIASHSLLLQQCVAPRVRLQGGVWQYPEPRTSGPGLWSQQRLQLLVQQMLRLPLPGTPAQRKKLVLASVTGVLGSIYVVAMCMLMARNGNASPLTMLYKL